MDVLRTPEERDDAEKRAEGELDAGRVVDEKAKTGELGSVKDYTVTEIEAMDLTQEQAQKFYDEEKASPNPRSSLLLYLEDVLEKGKA